MQSIARLHFSQSMANDTKSRLGLRRRLGADLGSAQISYEKHQECESRNQAQIGHDIQMTDDDAKPTIVSPAERYPRYPPAD